MLDPLALRDLYDSQLRPAEVLGLGERTVVERDGPLVRILGGHRGFVTGPTDLGIGAEELAVLVAAQRDRFAERGEAVEWKTRAHDRPAELFDALVAAGFVPEPIETVMIGTARTVALGTEMTPAKGVTLRQTIEPADMARIAQLESQVWDAEWSGIETDLCSRLALGSIEVFVAEAGDELVAAAWLAWKPGTAFAGLWGGATVADWRHRGVYRSLVAARARLAGARGVRYLQVDASDASRPILEQLGFVAVTTTTPYVWTPPA